MKYWNIDYYYDNRSICTAIGFSIIAAQTDEEAILKLKEERKITLINRIEETTEIVYQNQVNFSKNYKRWNDLLK